MFFLLNYEQVTLFLFVCSASVAGLLIQSFIPEFLCVFQDFVLKIELQRAGVIVSYNYNIIRGIILELVCSPCGL